MDRMRSVKIWSRERMDRLESKVKKTIYSNYRNYSNYIKKTWEHGHGISKKHDPFTLIIFLMGFTCAPQNWSLLETHLEFYL